MGVTRVAIRSLVLAASAWLALGCVKSPEVKRASRDMTLALGSIGAAEADFRQALDEQIDDARDQVARAFVARAVRARLDEEVAPHKTRAEALAEGGDLIRLSDEIDAAARGARELVALMKAYEPSEEELRRMGGAAKLDDEKHPEIVDAAIAAFIAKESAACREVRESPRLSKASRDAIERSCGRLSELAVGAAGDDFRTLVRLARIRAFVDRKLFAELDVHLAALARVHGVVDAWIQTDVVVRNPDIARLAEDAAKLVKEKAR